MLVHLLKGMMGFSVSFFSPLSGVFFDYTDCENAMVWALNL